MKLFTCRKTKPNARVFYCGMYDSETCVRYSLYDKIQFFTWEGLCINNADTMNFSQYGSIWICFILVLLVWYKLLHYNLYYLGSIYIHILHYRSTKGACTHESIFIFIWCKAWNIHLIKQTQKTFKIKAGINLKFCW